MLAAVYSVLNVEVAHCCAKLCVSRMRMELCDALWMMRTGRIGILDPGSSGLAGP